MKTLAAAVITILAASSAHAQLCPLGLVAQNESGHRNIPNYRYDAHHTAGGHWQITDTNWRHFAPMVDIDLAKWPNALSAPEQLQGQVAGIIRAKLGCLPWVPYNARLRAVLGSSKGLSEGRALGAPRAYVASAHVRRTSPAVASLPQRPAWSSDQIARMTAPSGVFNPMNIAFR
jgi:hypothetical protein